MKNFIFILLAISTATIANAQLHVKNSSFIYSKGTDIFVKGSVNMDTAANFYLRKEAHLLQEDNVPNTGAGNLSIYQEGAANNFTYNYWGSPVSTTTGSGNQGFSNTQLFFPQLQAGFRANSFTNTTDFTALSTELVTAFQPATILPVGVRDGLPDQQTVSGSSIALVNPLRIASRWLFKYNNAGLGGGAGYASWQPFQTSADVVEPGYGFTMKGVDPGTPSPNLFPQGNSILGQRYDLRGRPNNGTITVSVFADDFTLIGNPYPSALDLKRFIIENTAVNILGDLDPANSEMDAQVLFWESRSTTHFLTDYIGGYGSYVPGNRNNLADDGMYIQSVFSRYDSAGNPSAGSTVGGTDGRAHPIGSGTGRRYAPVAQGFVIVRTPTTSGGPFPINTVGNPVFQNDQRTNFKEDGALSFFQAAPGSGVSNPNQTNPGFVRPKIYFSAAVNDLYVREFILAFGDDSTDGLDWGLEAVADNNLQVNDVYMAQQGKKLIIKTIPFAVTKKVPLSFDLRDPSQFEISIKSIQHFDTEFIFLHDKQNGTTYDLKRSIATLNLPAGNYNDRFEIIFEQPATLSTGSEELATAIEVFQNNERQQLSVLNPQLKEVNTIAIYDLAGRLIVSQKVNTQDSYTFNTADYSTGVYIVRLRDNANIETAVKVSIAN